MTDAMVPQPWDEYAERAVLGEALHAQTVSPDVMARCEPTDFYRPQHQQLAEVCWDLTGRDNSTDPASVLAELKRRRILIEAHWLASLMGSAVPMPTSHAKTIREHAVRRQIIAEATRTIQRATDLGTDPYDTAASASVITGTIAEKADPAEHTLTDVLDFVTGSLDYDWLVPGLLERGDRLMVTGEEGSGKSWLIRQIGVCVAAGIHPFTGVNINPLRVLQVDLENPTRHLRRGTWRLIEHAANQKRPVQRGHMFLESVPQGCDLTSALDESWLRRVCEHAQPDLLVIGPLYRMHAADMAKEEPARHLTAVIDSIRARHECAVLIETHSGHGGGFGPRDLRPVGSSLFRRWPEFGYGLRSEKGEDFVSLVPWRGSRDQRDWPWALRRGSDHEWPWVPHDRHQAALAAHWQQIEDSA